MTQCTAKSKRTGVQCQRPALTGKTVCYHHGGKTPQGIAIPQTKSGRYSKHIPTRMLATYETAKIDPELLALQDEVALIDARLVDLLKRVDTGESGATWRKVGEAFRSYQQALSSSKTDAKKDASDYLHDLHMLIVDGASDEAAWTEIRSVVNQRRSLVESERKRLVEMQQMVGADQAMLLVRSLVASVREHVRDPAILRAITDDLGRLALARAD